MSKESGIKHYYDKRYLSSKKCTSRTSRYNAFIQPLCLEEGKRLLDVGCGTGEILRIVQAEGLSCAGIDISKEAVQLAQQKVNAATCEVTIGDGEHLPFADASFDYVTAIGSLEHFCDIEKGIREIARVCRNDGKVCIVVPNSYGILNKASIYDGTEQVQEKLATLSQWRGLLEGNGLDVIQVGRDKGPDICADNRPHKVMQRLLLRLTVFMPLSMAYQFIFVCRKKDVADAEERFDGSHAPK